ncbi:hypothetical protein M3Y99_00149100 [Aphelenchoides fujianensis]|nr:hypothetical protein M3Y99_00149100 [Aphelenchoides fujianensis]
MRRSAAGDAKRPALEELREFSNQQPAAAGPKRAKIEAAIVEDAAKAAAAEDGARPADCSEFARSDGRPAAHLPPNAPLHSSAKREDVSNGQHSVDQLAAREKEEGELPDESDSSLQTSRSSLESKEPAESAAELGGDSATIGAAGTIGTFESAKESGAEATNSEIPPSVAQPTESRPPAIQTEKREVDEPKAQGGAEDEEEEGEIVDDLGDRLRTQLAARPPTVFFYDYLEFAGTSGVEPLKFWATTAECRLLFARLPFGWYVPAETAFLAPFHVFSKRIAASAPPAFVVAFAKQPNFALAAGLKSRADEFDSLRAVVEFAREHVHSASNGAADFTALIVAAFAQSRPLRKLRSDRLDII